MTTEPCYRGPSETPHSTLANGTQTTGCSFIFSSHILYSSVRLPRGHPGVQEHR